MVSLRSFSFTPAEWTEKIVKGCSEQHMKRSGLQREVGEGELVCLVQTQHSLFVSQ